jgi:hypothetical protein
MFKKFWIIIFIMLPLCTHADNVKLDIPWQQKEKYEVKSDIINFNYTEMAYPVKKGNFGIPLETETKQQPPRKLVRKKVNDDKFDQLLNGMITGGIGIFALFIVSVPFIILMMIAYIWLDSHGKKKRDKMDKKKVEKQAEGNNLKFFL